MGNTCEGSSNVIDICMALDQSVSPHTWCADYSKHWGFLAGGISTASCPLPFFGTRLRRQNFNLAPTQYRQLRRLLFYMFPTDFRFRNHVFPQSLTCVYVAETRYSVPETCYFVRSTGGNVKIRSGNLTCFSVFPSVFVTA